MPPQAGQFGRSLELLQPLQRQRELYCRRPLNNPGLVENVLQTAMAIAYKNRRNNLQPIPGVMVAVSLPMMIPLSKTKSAS